MVGLSISDALAKIQGSSLKSRREGLSDLGYVLEQNRRASKQKLNDKNYHELLKPLFEAIRLEKSNYLKGTRNSEERLVSCADALRMIVDHGVTLFRRKHSMPALLDHIIQTFPLSEGILCEPLAKPYVKILRVLFEHQPHADHLSKDEWQELASLCISGIHSGCKALEDGDEDEFIEIPGSARPRARSSRSATPASMSISLRSTKKSFPSTRPSNAFGDQVVEDLFVCLHLLLSVPHQPVLEMSSSSVDVVLKFLGEIPPLSQTQSQQYAFSILNTILSATLVEGVEAALRLVQHIIPQIRRLWQPKTHSTLKEQMTLFLVLCKPLLRPILEENSPFHTELQRLFDVLLGDYKKRKQSDLLQCDDVVFRPARDHNHEQTVPMSNRSFHLKLGFSRSEQAWVLLSLLADLFNLIHSHARYDSAADTENNAHVPNKRRKVEHPISTRVNKLSALTGSDLVANLQLLAFISLELGLDQSHELLVIEKVSPLVTRDDPQIASWALLVLTSIASCCGSRQEQTKSNIWMRGWNLACRAITSSHLCRSACHLLSCLLCWRLVEYQEIRDSLDTILSSMDLNGPFGFCDSACQFWCLVLQLKASNASASAYSTSKLICQWMFNRWKPGLAVAEAPIKNPTLVAPWDVVELTSSLLGLQMTKLVSPSNSEKGILAQAIIHQNEQAPLLHYLLLAKDEASRLDREGKEQLSNQRGVDFSEFRFNKLCKDMLNFLEVQITTAVQSEWFINPSSGRRLGSEIISIIMTLGLTTSSLMSNTKARKCVETGQVEESLSLLSQGMLKIISKQDDLESVLDGVLSSFKDLLNFRSFCMASEGARQMARFFGPQFWNSLRTDEDDRVNDDLMTIDENLESQNSRVQSDTQDTSGSRKVERGATDAAAYRTTQKLRICLASFIRPATIDNNPVIEVSDSFFDFVVQMPAGEVLSARGIFTELIDAGAVVSAKAVSIFLEYLGEEMLQPDEFERCEAAHSFILEMLTGFADVWTCADEELAQLAFQIYNWYVTVALPKKILSPRACVCLAKMLQKVLELRPDFAQAFSLESARTTLFRVFEEGSVMVKFFIGQDLSSIFNFFVLNEHDNILDDVLASLPLDSDWIEVSAVRVYVLRKLGARWSTLLRKCIYAIVEGPVLIPSCLKYSQRCFHGLTTDLRMSSPKHLFELFASQILYTWLDNHELKSLPFQVLGYDALQTLLKDAQVEATAQIIMRGRDSEANQLSDSCANPLSTLLRESFARCAAYCIARDAAVASNADPQAAQAALRFKKLIGKDVFGALLSENFPDILSTLFRIADREDSISRGFQKHNTFTAASSAYDEIMSSSASQTPLNVSQQPSFKATYLVDEIDYLCSNCELDPVEFWSPALYVYVFRQLVQTIHPALGSLYTCSVVRRLRILISMAGETALRDYPLEMSLHSLRRFVVDTHCAEDVIGLARYLLSHATAYLQQVPSFLTGFVVSVMVSLRAFLDSPRDSTTQESQYIATMSKAKDFHQWLSKFIAEYTSPRLRSFDMEMMKRIVHAASEIRSGGTSKRSTAESDLLSMVLDDQASGGILVNQSSRNIILDTLCSDFELAATFREDIAGEKVEAARYAPLLLRTASRTERGKHYSLWIAHVLGRAYAGAGSGIIDILQRAMRKSMEVDPVPVTGNFAKSSKSAIISFLVQTLHTNHLPGIGIAERALQAIISSTDSEALLSECFDNIESSLKPALTWYPYKTPKKRSEIIVEKVPQQTDLAEALQIDNTIPYTTWVRRLCLALIQSCASDPLLDELDSIMTTMSGMAENLFSQVLHIALLQGTGKKNVRSSVSSAFRKWMNEFGPSLEPYVRQAIAAILYLKTQPLPQEATKSDRNRWLDIDFRVAAEIAAKCNMFTTSSLFLEIGLSDESKMSSRRASMAKVDVPEDLLLSIYQNLDEKDSFYGIRQPSTLAATMSQLEFENSDFKSLSFRGAYYDSQIRRIGISDPGSEEQVIRLLDTVGLNAVSQALLSTINDQSAISQEAMFTTARKLERWDVAGASDSANQPAVLFKAFQSIHDSTDRVSIVNALNSGFATTLDEIRSSTALARDLRCGLSTLAILTEIEDIISSQGLNQLYEGRDRLQSRQEWMSISRFEDIKAIDSCRQTLFSLVSKSKDLQTLMRISGKEARIVEVEALLASSTLNRRHGQLQSSLNSTTYLTQLVDSSIDLGAKVDVAIGFEASNVLWDQGEMGSSIRMIQDIIHTADTNSQDIPVGKPKLLATLGNRISKARLEKPDEIIAGYLKPAIKELKGTVNGHEAGQVFHEFASFCDQQLQNSDNLEDFDRIQILRGKKKVEVDDLDRMIKAASSQSKDADLLKSMRSKAQKWFELDDREYQRLKEGRQSLLSQSLENYLLCLSACDDYDNDALRFSALWLENFNDDVANAAVKKQIHSVASRKFASLMNQWTSRQLDNGDESQKLLSNLIMRICTEHPFHGMYHLFTSCKSKGAKDSAALSRNAAATKIVSEIKSLKRTGPTWIAVHNSNVNFVRFAAEKIEGAKAREGNKFALSQLTSGRKLEQDVSNNSVPPPTMTIPLRADCNYEAVPRIHKYNPELSLASGISMPKIVTAIASDGRKFKQLFKSGNDDLRQDAIMEQVFDQVSSLLKHHAETRQRNLSIRTYKVLPLTYTAGIIEFVTDTIPLNNYLLPAHAAQFPNDMKANACRKAISEAQNKATEERVKTFRKICDRFHPVMRFFFMDRFLNPDEWFEKRLMYTRSTAAISMLGYILGLGDRHGQNILLDEKTGEVIHIDLGIAFETGRVLPVPEVVPFRLTRDLVDGMGVTKTEGVFRRCCEFTLDALRKEEYSIMTILDVLRYDPLYSWSISPLRIKRLQEDQQGEDVENTAAGKLRDKAIAGRPGGEKKDEEGEAERALTVVRKKLSKSLSVAATVSELIQQATDERNLAVLFAGWAAYL